VETVLQSLPATRPVAAANEMRQEILRFMPSYSAMSLPLAGAGHKHNFTLDIAVELVITLPHRNCGHVCRVTYYEESRICKTKLYLP
jgi:hypothetical protein